MNLDPLSLERINLLMRDRNEDMATVLKEAILHFYLADSTRKALEKINHLPVSAGGGK
jgi:hypothetical protein